MLQNINKQYTSPSLRALLFPKLQIFVKMFPRNLQSQVWKRHVGVPLSYTNMEARKWCKHLELTWLSRQLIISTEQTSIYISTFLNALTSKSAQNHEISTGIQFSTNSIIHVALCQLHNLEIQNALFSKQTCYWAIKLI